MGNDFFDKVYKTTEQNAVETLYDDWADSYDADVTVCDLSRKVTLTDEMMANRSGWTPFHGMEVQGFPVGTIIRGQKVMWEGDVLLEGQGRPVEFQETIRA